MRGAGGHWVENKTAFVFFMPTQSALSLREQGFIELSSSQIQDSLTDQCSREDVWEEGKCVVLSER